MYCLWCKIYVKNLFSYIWTVVQMYPYQKLKKFPGALFYITLFIFYIVLYVYLVYFTEILKIYLYFLSCKKIVTFQRKKVIKKLPIVSYDCIYLSVCC